MKYTTLFLLLLIFVSCEDLMFEEDIETDNPKKNFDYLWNQCNEKYSYFELKGINWDEIYNKYSPKIKDDMSDIELFNVMRDMLKELKDDHTNLVSDFNISFFGVENLGRDNFNMRTIKDYYISDKYYITGPFIHDLIKRKNIGYIRFGSFTGKAETDNLNFILNRYSNTKGLILDLRENGGGAASDIFSILSHFVSKKTKLYYSVIKNGAGKNDFSEPEAAYVEPSDGIIYNKKVIVLVDRGTYSAGSFFALATKAIPNLVLMGDYTGGGLGMPNGGQLPNGWTYRFSITQALDLNMDNSYEKGVPPDIFAFFDWGNMTKDEVMEKAIKELDTN